MAEDERIEDITEEIYGDDTVSSDSGSSETYNDTAAGGADGSEAEESTAANDDSDLKEDNDITPHGESRSKTDNSTAPHDDSGSKAGNNTPPESESRSVAVNDTPADSLNDPVSEDDDLSNDVSSSADTSDQDDDEVLDLDEGKTYSDDDYEDEDNKKKPRVNLNLVLLVAILVIAVFCIVRIFLWNRGVKISFDPNEDTSQYDYEALDSILPLDPKNLEGHADDGKTTILFLGNSPLMAGGDTGTIADITVSTLNSKGKEAEAICAPISVATLSCVNDKYDSTSYADDAVALPNLADALVSGDFSLQRTDMEENHGDSTTSMENLDLLTGVDMDKVDVLCIFYDANDYFYGRQLISNGEKDSVDSALTYSVKKIQENYPWVRIILMTPYYRPGVDPEGNEFDPDTTVLNIEALPMYVLQEVKTAANLSITVVDNYYGSINGSNYSEYLDDNYNLTEKGVEKLASRLMYALTYYDG